MSDKTNNSTQWNRITSFDGIRLSLSLRQNVIKAGLKLLNKFVYYSSVIHIKGIHFYFYIILQITNSQVEASKRIFGNLQSLLKDQIPSYITLFAEREEALPMYVLFNTEISLYFPFIVKKKVISGSYFTDSPV